MPVSPLQSGAYWVQSSLTESFHLAAAMAATFLVLALRPLYYSGIKETTSILMILLLATISAFVVRVFAAKLISQRYGMWTEFRIDRTGLFVSLLTAIPFLPFRILVPGRIFIIGTRGTRMKIGRIALVGILATVALAMAFLSARSSSNNLAYAAALNADLALFSLFPFGSLDDKKVLDWDRRIWFIALAITLTLRLYLILK